MQNISCDMLATSTTFRYNDEITFQIHLVEGQYITEEFEEEKNNNYVYPKPKKWAHTNVPCFGSLPTIADQ